jgi:peptide deformylase
MAKRTITTDKDILHQKSEPVDPANHVEITDLLEDLHDSLPNKQLGLSAPQINTLKRVFIAWLPALGHRYGFVNPRFIEKAETKTPSTEGCLSLPYVIKTVERCAHVVIDADRIVKVGRDEVSFFAEEVQGPLTLTWLEAFVVQHEYDHLEGVLITDLEAVQSTEEKLQERNDKRKAKIKAKRQAKKRLQADRQTQISAKKPKTKQAAKKEKQRARKARKREQKRVEIEETFKAKQDGLFDPTA